MEREFKRFGIDIEKEKLERTAIYALACAYSVIERKISDYLRPFNLSPVKFNALMIIKHQGKSKGLSQVKIGKHLIVTASNMTRLLDRMSKEKLIERFPQKGDRRVNLIKITKKGSDILDKAWPGYCDRLVGIGGALKKNELEQISKLLLKWFDKLDGEAL